MRYPVRGILILIAVLLAFWLLQPHLRPLLFAAEEPRPVAARGVLADFENTTISLFERVSPSVVQVVVQRSGGGIEGDGLEHGQSGTGTGFVWDSAGNIVTNAHVVGDSDRVMIRTANGGVMPAEVVGRAASYDLAIVRITG